jgi:hypothetical protein
MSIDRYTKAILTVIALALTALAVNPWLGTSPTLSWTPRAVEAQQVPAPGPAPIQIPTPPAFAQWWDDCTATSKETVPVSWGQLVTTTTGAFVFVGDDTIRLARFAPYEVVTPEPAPGKKPCKILEIKRTK